MKCALCRSSTLEDLCNADSKSGEDLRVSMCQECGLIQQNPIPTVEELKEYYSHNYRIDYKDSYTPKNKHIYRAGKIALQRLEFMKKEGIQGGRLLDIGAGGGEFVYLSDKMGFCSQGIDPNIGYSEYAKSEYNCKLNTGELYSVQGKYEIVTLYHVLEHLPCPLFAFEKLYHLLSPQGTLAVEVPWIESNDASPNNIFFKAHIYYFGIDSLIACASKYFDVLKVDTKHNLSILFKAKENISETTYPGKESVSKLRNRLKSKGWIEYLTKGRGLQKPLKSLIRKFEESQVNNHQPKEILDGLLQNALQ